MQLFENAAQFVKQQMNQISQMINAPREARPAQSRLSSNRVRAE
jgi:hypothetical protein